MRLINLKISEKVEWQHCRCSVFFFFFSFGKGEFLKFFTLLFWTFFSLASFSPKQVFHNLPLPSLPTLPHHYTPLPIRDNCVTLDEREGISLISQQLYESTCASKWLNYPPSFKSKGLALSSSSNSNPFSCAWGFWHFQGFVFCSSFFSPNLLALFLI